MTDYASIRDGRVFESATPIPITRELIADFCAAIGETNPLYTDPAVASAGPHGGIVAPPSLAAIFGDGENIFRHYPAIRYAPAAGRNRRRIPHADSGWGLANDDFSD